MVRMVRLEIRGDIIMEPEKLFVFFGVLVTSAFPLLQLCFLQNFLASISLTLTLLQPFFHLYFSCFVSYCFYKSVLVYQVCCNKVYHKPDVLKQTYCLSVLVARGVKSRCLQGHTSSKSFKEDSFLASSRFWWLSAIPDISLLVDISLQSQSLCLYGILPRVSLCLHMGFFSMCVYA